MADRSRECALARWPVFGGINQTPVEGLAKPQPRNSALYVVATWTGRPSAAGFAVPHVQNIRRPYLGRFVRPAACAADGRTAFPPLLALPGISFRAHPSACPAASGLPGFPSSSSWEASCIRGLTQVYAPLMGDAEIRWTHGFIHEFRHLGCMDTEGHLITGAQALLRQPTRLRACNGVLPRRRYQTAAGLTQSNATPTRGSGRLPGLNLRPSAGSTGKNIILWDHSRLTVGTALTATVQMPEPPFTGDSNKIQRSRQNIPRMKGEKS